MPNDFYKILGVPWSATNHEIKNAYRKLILQYHPDKNESPAAAAMFIKIKEAYEILVDKGKRRAYDKSRETVVVKGNFSRAGSCHGGRKQPQQNASGFNFRARNWNQGLGNSYAYADNSSVNLGTNHNSISANNSNITIRNNYGTISGNNNTITITNNYWTITGSNQTITVQNNYGTITGDNHNIRTRCNYGAICGSNCTIHYY